jgi:hypothetical protein
MTLELAGLTSKLDDVMQELEDLKSEVSDLEDRQNSEDSDSDEAAPVLEARETLESIVESEDFDTIVEEVKPDIWAQVARAAGVVEMLEPLLERAIVEKIQKLMKTSDDRLEMASLKSLLDDWKDEELQEARDFFDHPSYKYNLGVSEDEAENGLKLGIKLLIALFRNRYPRIFYRNVEKSRETLDIFFECLEGMIGGYVDDLEPLIALAGYSAHDSWVHSKTQKPGD